MEITKRGCDQSHIYIKKVPLLKSLEDKKNLLNSVKNDFKKDHPCLLSIKKNGCPCYQFLSQNAIIRNGHADFIQKSALSPAILNHLKGVVL